MFVSHILIEVTLDALWIRDRPELATEYYAAIESISAEAIEAHVNRITGATTDRLAPAIRRFADNRFLYDYSEPRRLLFRLNQVMQRVGLERLPASLEPWLREAHQVVESRRIELLTRPDGSTPFPTLPQD